ncbi:MAG: hypothetical protein ACI4UH_07655 [Dorea sp.]
MANIDKKDFFGENEDHTFADDFDRAFSDTSAKDMEKVFMEELPDLPDELGSDGYKDVLSSLSQLDKTGDVSIDYLDVNRTRTLRLGEEYNMESGEDSSPKDEEDAGKKKLLSHILSRFFKK